MTIIVTWSKKNQRYRSDISRVDFAEPLVTLHTLRPSEALVGACIGRESTLVGCCGEVGGGGGKGGWFLLVGTSGPSTALACDGPCRGAPLVVSPAEGATRRSVTGCRDRPAPQPLREQE